LIFLKKRHVIQTSVILLSVKHNKKQAGAQLCQAEDQLGLPAEAELLLRVDSNPKQI
jgi:hypothetical protein